MIEMNNGNLLEARVEALVNTVNTVGVMGKGIALQFKQAFPTMFRDYAMACKTGDVRLGKMHVFDLGGLAGGPALDHQLSHERALAGTEPIDRHRSRLARSGCYDQAIGYSVSSGTAAGMWQWRIELD